MSKLSFPPVQFEKTYRQKHFEVKVNTRTTEPQSWWETEDAVEVSWTRNGRQFTSASFSKQEGLLVAASILFALGFISLAREVLTEEEKAGIEAAHKALDKSGK